MGLRTSRSKPRWSANRKIDVVLRLLRGESIEDVSREVGVEVHRLAAWRDDFLESRKQALKSKRPKAEGDQRLSDAERKIGELRMENESCGGLPKSGGSRTRCRGGRDSHGHQLPPLPGVCGARCTPVDGVSPRARGAALGCRPGPQTVISDDELVGEGYRKVRARL